MAVEIESVALLEWVGGEMQLIRWDRRRGLRPPERRRLDLKASRYRRVET